MRVIAILATYNEARFIAGCLEHLFRQGVEVYLMDNCSTDDTVRIAERYLERGLIGIETLPREGNFNLSAQLRRKEVLFDALAADWFMHVDADEILVPPRSDRTLAQAFADVKAQGYNAVNFLEFTFIPTQEAPDHDHPDFQKTMRWYYPYLPFFPHRLNAWKQQPGPVELAWSGGHKVRFPGLQMYPESFRMRHYLFLSVAHAIRKYVNQRYDPAEVRAGWFEWRARLKPEMITLPRQAGLRTYTSDDELDPSNPHTTEYIGELCEALWRSEQVRLADQELTRLIEEGERFILVDDEQLRGEIARDRDAWHFLERDGEYWGLPADDETGIAELERLRRAGARFIVFAWPAFWWLDYYSQFNRHLRSQFRCVLENDRLVVFNLQP